MFDFEQTEKRGYFLNLHKFQTDFLQCRFQIFDRVEPIFRRRILFHVLPSIDMSLLQIWFDMIFIHFFRGGMFQQIAIDFIKLMGQKTNSTMRRGAVDAEKSQCGCRELADLGKMTIQNEKYILDELG